MIVEVGALAEAELEHARAHYEAQREGLGRAFIDEVAMILTEIGARPLSYSLLARTKARRARFPYMLVFLVLVGRVRVLCVAHQHRRPKYWRGRI